MLPERHARIAQVHRVQKRLRIDKTREIGKLECPAEVGPVRVIKESRFQHSAEKE